MAVLTPPYRCDLAVVGAGIVGTMTAYLASAQHADWTIVLADRGLPGRGATAYSLALDIPYAASSGVRRLVDDSAPIYSSLAATMPACFRTLSAMAIVDAATTAEWLHRFSRTGVRLADARDVLRLRNRWPTLVLSPADTVLAGLTATCATPVPLIDRLALDLRRRGVQCWEGSEVTAVESGSNGVELTMADGRQLLAARVVIAVGPWIATGRWKAVADHLGVRIKKVVAMHLDLRPAADDPVVLFMADDAFLLPDPAGDRYLFSFASREWDTPVDAAQLRITMDDRKVALDILERRLPGLERQWTGGRVFCDAYTPDRVPLVAEWPTDRRLCFATGSSGSGFRLAPGMARAALEHLTKPSLQAAATGGGTG